MGGSIICPIHKKGPLDDPNNFRGISLIDVLNKVFTNILNERIKAWVDANQMIDESQAGFRKGYSATDNLFCLQAMAQKYLSKKNGRFYCLFVDFSKAFDTIDHAKLLTCLADKGVGGKLLRVLKSMYCNLRSCVQNNGQYTEFFTCNVGTRQGCILSPMLFNLFINELVMDIKAKCLNGIFITQDISDIFALLYADDIANCADTVVSLQSQLNLVESFCVRTGMRVNLSKTKIIVFRRGGFLRSNEKWYYQGQQVETVSYYKYMGILFTPKLIWTKAKEELAAQAKRALFTLYNVQNKLGVLSVNEAFKLFDTMIVPILTYASEIWGYEYSDPIEKVHDRFCINFLKLPRYTFSVLSRGEVGRMPLCYIYYCKIIKYWIRLIRMNDNRYPRQCYMMLKRLDDADRVTWVTKVRNLLCRYGFGYVWHNQDIGNEKQFMCMFKQRLRDNLIQEWYTDINNSSKAKYYRNFYDTFAVQFYIKLNLPTHLLRVLAKLRCSAHELNVEKGRHTGIPYHQRICTLCETNQVEDELHFVLQCPFYNDLRCRHIPKRFIRRYPCPEDFYTLMQCKNESIVTRLAHYLNVAFQRRNTALQNHV